MNATIESQKNNALQVILAALASFGVVGGDGGCRCHRVYRQKVDFPKLQYGT